MTTVSVWAFASADGATQALQRVHGAQTRRRLSIADCAVLEWPPDNHRPIAYQVGTADGAAMLTGAFWGLLFGSLFLAPLAGLTGPVWPPDGLARVGLPESLLQPLRLQAVPGTSALFVVSEDSALETLRDVLAGLSGPGSVCLAHVLTAQQDESLRRAFTDDEAAIPAGG